MDGPDRAGVSSNGLVPSDDCDDSDVAGSGREGLGDDGSGREVLVMALVVEAWVQGVLGVL